jgi:hypothetical protein
MIPPQAQSGMRHTTEVSCPFEIGHHHHQRAAGIGLNAAQRPCSNRSPGRRPQYRPSPRCKVLAHAQYAFSSLPGLSLWSRTTSNALTGPVMGEQSVHVLPANDLHESVHVGRRLGPGRRCDVGQSAWFASSAGRRLTRNKVVEDRLDRTAFDHHHLEDRLAAANFLLNGQNFALRRGLLYDCRNAHFGH